MAREDNPYVPRCSNCGAYKNACGGRCREPEPKKRDHIDDAIDQAKKKR